MRITYGTRQHTIDVTSICNTLKHYNIITIPADDNIRAQYFTDPLYGVLKSIFITIDNTTTEYGNVTIFINTDTNTVHTTGMFDPYSTKTITTKIEDIHRQLKIYYGSFMEELPEQKMVVRYLTGNENVLEIGGNIGRNSMIIAHILGENQKNLVVLESDSIISNQLKENRELNNMSFHIENSALSKRPLIQRGWDTIVSYKVLNGYKAVKCITYDELLDKYGIQFDTLVLDCEGAFYYILQDMPEILQNIKLIIMENDYTDITHKSYIDNVLNTHHFYVDYVESGGWGPCYNKFFEVWKRL